MGGKLVYASNEYFLPVMGLIFLRHAYSRFLAVKASIEATLPTRGGKPRARRADGAIAAIAGENVAGLFDLDLQPLFERLTSAFTGAATRLDLSSLPRRHVGYLDLQHHGDDTIVRVRGLSSR